MFELEKCSFFKWVRILPESDWYHFLGASPAPMCIVQHKTLKKTSTSEVSHQSPVCVCAGGGGSCLIKIFFCILLIYISCVDKFKYNSLSN